MNTDDDINNAVQVKGLWRKCNGINKARWCHHCTAPWWTVCHWQARHSAPWLPILMSPCLHHHIGYCCHPPPLQNYKTIRLGPIRSLWSARLTGRSNSALSPILLSTPVYKCIPFQLHTPLNWRSASLCPPPRTSSMQWPSQDCSLKKMHNWAMQPADRCGVASVPAKTAANSQDHVSIYQLYFVVSVLMRTIMLAGGLFL